MTEPQTPALKLDVDLVPDQSEDDSDAGWSERTPDSESDLRRFLDEVPPHHGD